jgi:hypothetical protein
MLTDVTVTPFDRFLYRVGTQDAYATEERITKAATLAVAARVVCSYSRYGAAEGYVT